MSASTLNKGTEHDALSAQNAFKAEKPTIAELKNKKVIFKQKCVSFEKLSETMQDIVKFREMLEQRLQRQETPFASFPDEHRPLIAKLAHESDKALPTLAKHIHHELLPTQEEGCTKATSDALPLQVVEAAIKSILSRNNYGLEAPQGNVKMPAALCVWRWEVKSQYWDWLPKAAKEKAEARLIERVQAKNDLAALVQAMSLQERDTLFSAAKTNSTAIPGTAILHLDGPAPSFQTSANETKSVADGGQNHVTNVAGPSQNNSDSGKVAKENGKPDKKPAKVDKEKKAKESQDKSRSIMANFFAKPKPIPKASRAADPTANHSEFERTFKPFVLKKDAERAPINCFLTASKGNARGAAKWAAGEVIIIEDAGETCVIDVDLDTHPVDLAKLTHQERLRSVLSSLPKVQRRARPPRISQYKTACPISVRTLFSQLTEAEIAGSTSRVRKLLSRLSSRTLLPAKVIIFHEDLRPGYFGTWTRSSTIIGPRSPFAKDVIAFDYGYDSGEEWNEDDVNGEDVDEGDEEEGEAVDDADSDLDSWLVDDDEVVELESERREPSPSLLLPILPPTAKRKLDTTEKESTLEKKRRAVVPLVPFAKGPVWEQSIGNCHSDAFTPYKIHLFNDTPYPIDPYTFVSDVQERLPSKRPPNDQSRRDFVVPALPGHLTVPGGVPLPVPNVDASVSKRVQSEPKTAFPEAQLSVLITKMTSLATGNTNFLVESVYQELREHKIKKNAILAKIKEVGQKCKEKKIWVVKDDIAVAQGLLL